MKIFVLSLILALANAKVIGSYDSGYDASSGSSDSYGSSGGDYGGSSSSDNFETKCTPYFETVDVDRCEHYQEKVCYTTQQESCQDVEDETCRGIIASRQVRQCFNVTELLCGLKEQVQYDVVSAVFTVQKCHKVTGKCFDFP